MKLEKDLQLFAQEVQNLASRSAKLQKRDKDLLENATKKQTKGKKNLRRYDMDIKSFKEDIIQTN